MNSSLPPATLNGKTQRPAPRSLVHVVLQAAAPGGVLTRRTGFIGMAVGFVAALGAFVVFLQVRAHENDPAGMRFSDPRISRLSTRSFVTDGAVLGHGEVRQYGWHDDPTMDAAVMMIVPPVGQSAARDFIQEVRGLDPVRSAARATMARTYELQTRFGMYQAAEIQVDMVGRWKDCIAYLSRFETPAVYIKGWYCDDIGTKPKPDRVACALDGLVIDHALPSDKATAFLRERSARPAFCGAIDRGEDRELRSLTGL